MEIEDLIYIKGSGIYSELHLNNGKKHLHNKSLDRLVQILPHNFRRVHKSFIVNRVQAKSLLIQSGGKYQLEMNNGEFIPVSRTRFKQLRQDWFSDDPTTDSK